MDKFVIVTTVPITFDFFKGNLKYLSQSFDVCAVSSNKEQLVEFGAQEGVKVHHIPMVRPISLWNDVLCLLKFILFFFKERPKVVHGNTPKGSMLSMVAAWVTRVPVRIYMCHGLRYQGTQGGLRKVLMWMEKLTCACATEVMCVSNGVRDTFAQDGICSLKKSIVIGHGSATGIDLEFFNPQKVAQGSLRSELGIPNDDFVFIFVGRIVADKGVNELVRAFDKLATEKSNIHLVLVGGEEDLNPIQEKSREIISSNERIYAIGEQPDVRPYLMEADAFVFPSYREGFGMVLIEANAMGIPTISSNIIGCNEVVIEGVNGELIPAKDEDALYHKMKEWVENPNKVLQMSQLSRKTVVDRFSRSLVWKNYLDEYLRLLKSC